MLGDQYPLEFDVKACDDLCEAMVSATLPEGVTYVRSQPEAQVEGRKITWNFGPMNKGECRPARVWLKCECEGEVCVCFCASAVPVRFCALLCAKPVLTCKSAVQNKYALAILLNTQLLLPTVVAAQPKMLSSQTTFQTVLNTQAAKNSCV